MKNKKIDIPNPCSEDFSKMSATEKGAFCKKCSHEVIDFTENTEDEIVNIISNRNGERVCGKMKVQQKSYSLQLWKIAASLAILPLSDSLFAQEEVQITDTNQVQVQNKPMQLRGIVRDENGEPLPFVKVMVKGNSIAGAQTDFDGKYKIKIPNELWLDNDSAQVIIKEYYAQSKEFSISKHSGTILQKDITILLLDDIFIKSEEVEELLGIIYIPPIQVRNSNPFETVIEQPFRRLDERD